MIDLNKERELYESVIEKTQDLKMVHLVGISFNEEKNQYEVPGEKWASELTDACLELNTGWFIWQECVKAKAQAAPVWVSTDFMLPDEGEAVLFIDKNNVIHDGYLNTDYVDGPYGENGEDFGDDQTLWVSNSNGDEFLLSEIKYWMHRPSGPSASESGAEG